MMNKAFFLLSIFGLLSFSSCSKTEDPIMTEDMGIAGAWAGVIKGEEYDDFKINVSIADPTINAVIGTGNYDGECTFNWTFVGMDRESFLIEEKILTGTDYCVDDKLKLELISNNRLSYILTGPDYTDNQASGIMSRVQ